MSLLAITVEPIPNLIYISLTRSRARTPIHSLNAWDCNGLRTGATLCLQTRPKIYGITYDFKTAHGEQ